jgi:toxin ParE1/3/4
VKRRIVVFSPEAQADLIEIYEWILTAAGPQVALTYIERLESHCLGLDIASERGRRRDDLRPGLRVAGERRITVAFAVDEDQVTILRLFSRGRDWEESFA